MKININIPREAKIALNILIKNGFEAYVVGGCVRDSLLGIVPNDWDITTSAKPGEIIDCFQNYRTINTGLKHGTLTVIIEGMQIEITTYRIDGRYSDNRHPDSVFFTDDVSYDLKRRDFTINSLAYNNNGIVDLFGGIDNIKNKIIKCVGDPDERFNEDGLRILRALRFASVLEFTIDHETSVSIHRNKGLLNSISKERIANEFNKFLTGCNFYKIMIEYKDVVEVFIPYVKGFDNDTWENILNSMRFADSLDLKLTLLLYKTNCAENILKKLKYDGATVKKVRTLVFYKDEEILPDRINIKRQLNKMGYENYVNFLKFKSTVFRSQSDKYEQNLINIKNSGKILNDIVVNNECYSLKDLQINGKDLIELGLSEGAILGSILNKILNLVIEGKLKNVRNILIDRVKQNI